MCVDINDNEPGLFIITLPVCRTEVGLGETETLRHWDSTMFTVRIISETSDTDTEPVSGSWQEMGQQAGVWTESPQILTLLS